MPSTIPSTHRIIGLAAIISASLLTACTDSAETSSGGQGGNNNSGGNASGGNAAGGNATGGDATGGNATGGNATGGNATGGNATGGGQNDCMSAADCDDDDACTDDVCEANGVCSHSAVDPDDSDACTADSCDAVQGIINAAIDPDDNDACTTDSCDSVQGVSNTPVDPDDGNACTVDTCDATTGIANTVIDPDDSNACTIDSCDPATGVSNVPEVVLFEEPFVDNSQGWTVGPEWMIGTAQTSTGGAYGADPATDHTATADNGVAGAVIGGNVSTAVHGYYYLLSPTINAVVSEGHLTLSYWRWLNADYEPYMSNKVDVWDGAQWQNVWASGALPGVQDSPPFGGGWVEYRFDITPYANAGLQVRFGYNVLQTGLFTIGGWNLDDVSILNTAIVSDDSVCTEDTCDAVNGVSYTALTLNDSNACTNDSCDEILAIHHPNIDPNDNNACTNDSCDINNGVSNAPISCDDNDSCTADSCNMIFGCANDVIPQPHDKCDVAQANTPLLDCPNEACVQQVCAVDPFCCNTDWDSSCVGEVFSVCDSKLCDASAGNCSQNLCSVSATPHAAGCDAGFGDCVTQICAVDSFCCDTSWDSVCVGRVSTTCGLNCN